MILLLSGPTSAGDDVASHPIVSVDELARARGAGEDLLVIDVRTRIEHRLGHPPDVLHLPSYRVKDELERLEAYRDHRLYILCMTGHRSVPVTRWLVEQGFDAVDVAGGYLAWRKAGHPIE